MSCTHLFEHNFLFTFFAQAAMKDLSRIVITCPPRIEPYLKEEVEDIGFDVLKQGRMSVELEGTIEDCMLLNLHLRTGNRILYQIESFRATTPEQLYAKVSVLPWEDWIDANGYVSINSFVKNDFINDTRFANLKVKDAIVDRLMEKCNERPDSGSNFDRTVVFLHWVNDECKIYFDTSGETIAKHGYRKNPFKAPMQESLAAAVIMASAWDRKSVFINPMCGSGTLAIEAALLATRRPPGFYRNNFGFMHIKGYDVKVWQRLKQEASEMIKRSARLKILASDHDEEAIEAAMSNAKAAGVSDMIKFVKSDFRRINIPDQNGVIFMNPEYGERLGDERRLEAVYRDIGDFLKQKCQGYTGYIFTGNLNLTKKIGLKPKRRLEFYNGRIDCRLLEYELYTGSRRNREDT